MNDLSTKIQGNTLKLFVVHATIVLVVFLFYVIYQNNPLVSSFYPPCFFHKLTGLYCPGCGSARALYHLLHLNIITAIDQNVFAVISTPFVAWHFIRLYINEVFGRNLKPVFFPGYTIIAILVLILIFWVIRNLPYYPFSMLAPDG